MRRPPRSPAEQLLSARLIAWGVVQGAFAFAMVGGMFVFALRSGMPDDEVRALVFVALILGIFSLVLVNRSFSPSLKLALVRPNVALVSILFGVCAILGLCLAVPSLRELFKFGRLHFDDLTMTVASALVVLLALESLKPFWRTPRF